MQVNGSRKSISCIYRLHGHGLETVTSAKYLGLMSRVVLPGTPTLKELPVMPIKPLGFLRRNVKTKMPRITETNYSTLVRLQLEYALAVWDSHAKDKINQIEWCSAGLPDGLASIIDIDIEALFNVKNVQQITYAL